VKEQRLFRYFFSKTLFLHYAITTQNDKKNYKNDEKTTHNDRKSTQNDEKQPKTMFQRAFLFF